MELQINNLFKNYGDKCALNGINLSLKEGIYGFLGANGSGKSTTMKIICGLLEPTKGQIRVDGKDIVKMDEEFRNIIGYLPQDFGYYPEFTAKEFMMYIAILKGLSTSEANKKTKELLSVVGLDDVANKKIKTFSGGMKQRIGIAQAVLNDPKILILDEPTSGLDPKERIRFRNIISTFSKEKIIILSTHIVSDIEYISDEILMIKKGEIISTGSVAKLISGIEGLVWECSVNKNESNQLNIKYPIVKTSSDGTDIVMRIVSQKKPIENAINVSPTLEDLYLYHFSDEIQ